MSEYDEYDIILLEPWSGYNIGDIIAVNQGMYNTLIDLKKGLPLDCYEDNITDNQRLVINAKHLKEENDGLYETNRELYDKMEDLDDEIADLKDKIKSYETKKTKTKKKVTAPRKKKTPKEL